MLAGGMLLMLAAGPPPTGAGPDIVVTGRRPAFELPLRRLRAAQRRFAEDRSAFAPDAALLFRIARAGGSASGGPPVALRLERDGVSLPVPVDGDGRFALPAPPDGADDWRLVADQSAGALRVRPLVRSPGAELPSLRLGDLRLQCRVTMAFATSGASLLAQPMIGMMRAAGPCTNRRVGVYERLAGPVAAAELVEGDRRRPVALRRGDYRNPGFERDFSNEARMVVRLR